MNTQPHSTWAEVYDLAYERSFGELYSQLTLATVHLVGELVHPPAAIVDFGAGTGRLSIPLAELGFAITAVDPSMEMLRQMEGKYRHGQLRIVHSKMEDFKSEEQHDVALCVFTVLLYLLDEESLTKAFAAAYGTLKPDGILLVDIPSRSIFRGYSISDHLIERSVSVTNQSGDIFNYQESLKVRHPSGEESAFSDSFQIRHWSLDQVMRASINAGFVLQADISDSFSGTGSNYYLLKKTK